MKVPNALHAAFAVATLSLTAFPQNLSAQANQAEEPAVDARLLAKYEGMLEQLRAELTPKLPKPDDQPKVEAFLKSDKLDDQLVKLAVLAEATPRHLAEFSQLGKENEALIDRLLADPVLMKQMLIADGARRRILDPNSRGGRTSPTPPCQYGPAMKIYTDILKASPKAKEGVLHNLALAVALEHAIPIFDHDPVARYLEFEKAYLDGDLDPAFANFSAWELRFVVDGNEPDWARAWGRETLRNYRPDHILTTNAGSRYAGIVRTNVIYGGERVGQDQPELNVYQNILMNGGICGRRAFFGRFILRCFGIPSTARPSRAHGALVRWTPKGWVPYLGPRWGSGSTNTIYGADRNFLATTQARESKDFIQVKRAQWAGDVRGERRIYGGQGDTKTWGGVSLLRQQEIIKALKAVEQGPVDAKLGEANVDDDGIDAPLESPRAKQQQTRTLSPGEISIPLEHYKLSRENTSRVNFMDGYYGGKQFYFGHFGRNGRHIYRGGAASTPPEETSSENRLRESGRGGYNNWGFRPAMDPKDGETTPQVKVDLGNGTSIDFIYVKPGTFTMGGENTTQTSFVCTNTPKHQVTLTKGYYLAKTELTKAQFAAAFDVQKDTVPDPDHPQGGIRPDGAERFCRLINEKTGRTLRMPTEAEWEFAARAGTSTTWFFGNDPAKLGDYAWYRGNGPAGKAKPLQPVGQKKPNPWGFHDMYGNAWEIVADTYDKDYFAQGPKVDPTGPPGSVASEIEFEVNIPADGKYALTASVVTMNHNQTINVAVNDDPHETQIDLPFTLGKWQDTEPVVLNLSQGTNILKFCRKNAPQYGVALNALILKPTN